MLTTQEIVQEGLAVREANHRMLNMLTTFMPSFAANFPSSTIKTSAAR